MAASRQNTVLMLAQHCAQTSLQPPLPYAPGLAKQCIVSSPYMRTCFSPPSHPQLDK